MPVRLRSRRLMEAPMAHRRTSVLVSAALCILWARDACAQQNCVGLNIAGVYSGSAFYPGVDDLGIHCDDCTAAVTFPFPVRMYGANYTSAVVSSNGNVQFDSDPAQSQEESLPTPNIGTAVFPLWDDLV